MTRRWPGLPLPEVALPEGLEMRLRSLPTTVVLCRDLDRELEPTGAVHPSALAAHLEGCARCRWVHGAVAVAREASLPMPEELHLRLRRFARTQEALGRPGVSLLSAWIAQWTSSWSHLGSHLIGDVRLATGASYIAAALVMLVFGHQAGALPTRLAAEVRSVAAASGVQAGRWAGELEDLSQMAGEVARDPRRLESWWRHFQSSRTDEGSPGRAESPAEDADASAAAPLSTQNPPSPNRDRRKADGPEELP